MPESYQPSPEIMHVLDKWTTEDGTIVSHDVAVLWEEILRLSQPVRVAGVKTEGSGF